MREVRKHKVNDLLSDGAQCRRTLSKKDTEALTGHQLFAGRN